jgi:hypothetical protein
MRNGKPSVYSCWLQLTYVAKDGEVVFARYLELPFAPYEGLHLILDDDDKAPDWFDVENVQYYVPDDVFWLSEVRDVIPPDDQYGCPCSPGEGCCDVASELTYAQEHGWEVEQGPRYGFDRLYRRPWMHQPGQHYWNKPDDADPDEPETSAQSAPS